MSLQQKKLESKPQCLVVGMNALCGAGFNRDQIYESVINGTTSVNQQGLAPVNDIQWQFFSKSMNIPNELYDTRCLSWLYYLIQSSYLESQWTSKKSTGLIYASTTSNIELWHHELPALLKRTQSDPNKTPYQKEAVPWIQAQSLMDPIQKLQKYFNFEGPKTVLTSACSASLQALALGALWIESGLVERCLVVSSEVLNPLTNSGFDGLRLLSKEICKPFDRDRKGINLGEGAAVICLESSKSVSPTKQILGRIRGFGLSTDAFHTTSPQPQGEGAFRAMQQALQMSQINPSDIDWVYTHGTASISNDQAEVHALQKLFNENKTPPMVSTKSIHGHTLATSGLLESVIGLMFLQNHKVPQNHFTKNWDPKLGLSSQKLEPQETESQNLKTDIILKNALGFGGINASLILSRN